MVSAQSPQNPLNIAIQDRGKPISPMLFGVFFEDLSYAADGGLYAELVQNRSFEYTGMDAKGWDSLTGWTLALEPAAVASLKVEDLAPINSRNPHYAVLDVAKAGGQVAVRNAGFDGMVIHAGETYNLSLFARQMGGEPETLLVRIESSSGDVLGSIQLPPPGRS